jgi:hypothetical protein
VGYRVLKFCSVTFSLRELTLLLNLVTMFVCLFYSLNCYDKFVVLWVVFVCVDLY